MLDKDTKEIVLKYYWKHQFNKVISEIDEWSNTHKYYYYINSRYTFINIHSFDIRLKNDYKKKTISDFYYVNRLYDSGVQSFKSYVSDKSRYIDWCGDKIDHIIRKKNKRRNLLVTLTNF